MLTYVTTCIYTLRFNHIDCSLTPKCTGSAIAWVYLQTWDHWRGESRRSRRRTLDWDLHTTKDANAQWTLGTPKWNSNMKPGTQTIHAWPQKGMFTEGVYFGYRLSFNEKIFWMNNIMKIYNITSLKTVYHSFHIFKIYIDYKSKTIWKWCGQTRQLRKCTFRPGTFHYYATTL